MTWELVSFICHCSYWSMVGLIGMYLMRQWSCRHTLQRSCGWLLMVEVPNCCRDQARNWEDEGKSFLASCCGSHNPHSPWNPTTPHHHSMFLCWLCPPEAFVGMEPIVLGIGWKLVLLAWAGIGAGESKVGWMDKVIGFCV